jgi:hypothetical protein
LRFAFYGRVSTEDHQDPVTSRARQRDQAGALVAAMADAIVIGEYERAFYGSQHALMAPLFEHYGVQLIVPLSALSSAKSLSTRPACPALSTAR